MCTVCMLTVTGDMVSELLRAGKVMLRVHFYDSEGVGVRSFGNGFKIEVVAFLMLRV